MPNHIKFQHISRYLLPGSYLLHSMVILSKLLKLEQQFDIIALVTGGGLTSQTDAILLGVSRLLCKMEKQNRSILKPYGFLTRDARIKERKKYGLRKARKAPQYSKR